MKKLFFLMCCILSLLLFLLSSKAVANECINASFCYRKKVINLKRKCVYWNEFSSNPREIRLLQALNRRNTPICIGQELIVPKYSYDYIYYAPVSPFLFSRTKRYLLIDPNKLVWALYIEDKLTNWGPISAGTKKCKETGALKCKTPTGIFKILRKEGEWKKSNIYPLNCINKKICGVRMPYYIRLHSNGTGLHAATTLPGYNASHGCIRLLREDAMILYSILREGDNIQVREY